MTHFFQTRVYYEDTDLAGIVYYANYLKFIERARTEWARDQGIDQVEMKQAGQVFAVRRVEADYLSPARFDDVLTITTHTARTTPARIELIQTVLRGDQTLFVARITLACLDDRMRPTRLPAALRR